MLHIDQISCHLNHDKILYVSWLDYDPFMKFSFEQYFFNLIESIEKKDIKKLILDCSFRRHHPSDHDFIDIFEMFLGGLSATHLEKMARIMPEVPQTSAKFNYLLQNLITELDL